MLIEIRLGSICDFHSILFICFAEWLTNSMESTNLSLSITFCGLRWLNAHCYFGCYHYWLSISIISDCPLNILNTVRIMLIFFGIFFCISSPYSVGFKFYFNGNDESRDGSLLDVFDTIFILRNWRTCNPSIQCIAWEALLFRLVFISAWNATHVRDNAMRNTGAHKHSGLCKHSLYTGCIQSGMILRSFFDPKLDMPINLTPLLFSLISDRSGWILILHHATTHRWIDFFRSI